MGKLLYLYRHSARLGIYLLALFYVIGVSAIPAHACDSVAQPLPRQEILRTPPPCHESQPSTEEQKQHCCDQWHCVKCVSGVGLEARIPSLFLPSLYAKLRLPQPEVATTLILDTPERPPKIG